MSAPLRPAESPPGERSPEPAGERAPFPSIFGLGAAEMELLGATFAPPAAELGLDGARIIEGLSRGTPLSTVLGLPPRFAEVLYGRAHTWFTAGRFDRAENLFRTLCVIEGRTADYWVGYGVCLRKRASEAEAELAFATAAALRPNWAVPYFHAAELAVARQQWDKAQDHLDAYAARDHEGLPAAMRQEAGRLRRALRLRATLRSEQAQDAKAQSGSGGV